MGLAIVGLLYGTVIDVATLLKYPVLRKLSDQLTADFDARQHRVPDGSSRQRGDHIGLIEDVEPLGVVVVRRKRDLRFVGVHRARHVILIRPFVVANERAIADGDGARLMRHAGRKGVGARAHLAPRRVAEVRGRIDICRLTVK